MSQAKHIVSHAGASGLPKDVARGIEESDAVTIDVADPAEEPRFMRFRGIGAYRNTSIEEAVARVRALRDEWD